MTDQGDVGFIVQAFAQPLSDGTRLCFVGRLATGETFAAVRNDFHPSFFVRRGDLGDAQEALGPIGFEVHESWWKTMDGREIAELRFQTLRDVAAAGERLALRSVRTYEADVKATDRFLMDQRVHGSCVLRGEYSQGRYVDRVYIDPELSPADWRPTLEVLALDIETEPAQGTLRAVSLVGWTLEVGAEDRSADLHTKEVLLLPPETEEANRRRNGETTQSAKTHATSDAPADETAAESAHTYLPEYVTVCRSESDLLSCLVTRISSLDPDIVTGWNVIEFDFRTIADRLAAHKIPFSAGRSRDLASFLDSRGRGAAGVSVPGRQVIDAMRLVRYGPDRFEDRRLDTVAHAILGTGKTEAAQDSEKLTRLEELYQTDPAEYCRYCLVDSELVIRILAKTGLMELTIMRCLLIGIALNRAWTSIAAFEFLYIEGLHARGMVAPTLGVDQLPLDEAPGGAILTPHPGVFRNVFVFDFKSLYPSIIRTFNIDPTSLVPASIADASTHPRAPAPPVDGRSNGPPAPDAGAAEPIEAPGGTQFRREPGILPALLDRFFENRQAAKDRGDDTASYVYKIIMNSFYGVLGAKGCRFAGSALAGSITGFGQHLLRWCRDELSDQGYRVIYGDTDSLFVTTDIGDDTAADRVQRAGETIAETMNALITDYVESRWNVHSRLELEFEKVYTRFFLPAIRHSLPQEELRGRAKGYAGMVLSSGELEIRGMEAVRSDWTVAAGEFQRELLSLVFRDAPVEEIAEYVRRVAEAVRSGELDEKLVYSKNLRKNVSEYTRSSPPHVQAARLLPPAERHGAVRYIITTEGPQPADRLTAAIDYPHYLEKQLRPIAESIADFVQLPMASLDGSSQLNLFE